MGCIKKIEDESTCFCQFFVIVVVIGESIAQLVVSAEVMHCSAGG